MIQKFNKITFVTQVFERKEQRFICVEQNFTAGHPVDRENENGDPEEEQDKANVFPVSRSGTG